MNTTLSEYDLPIYALDRKLKNIRIGVPMTANLGLLFHSTDLPRATDPFASLFQIPAHKSMSMVLEVHVSLDLFYPRLLWSNLLFQWCISGNWVRKSKEMNCERSYTLFRCLQDIYRLVERDLGAEYRGRKGLISQFRILGLQCLKLVQDDFTAYGRWAVVLAGPDE